MHTNLTTTLQKVVVDLSTPEGKGKGGWGGGRGRGIGKIKNLQRWGEMKKSVFPFPPFYPATTHPFLSSLPPLFSTHPLHPNSSLRILSPSSPAPQKRKKGNETPRMAWMWKWEGKRRVGGGERGRNWKIRKSKTFNGGEKYKEVVSFPPFSPFPLFTLPPPSKPPHPPPPKILICPSYHQLTRPQK